MNNYLKIGTSIFLSILLNVFFQIEILNAQVFECPIAISESMYNNFREIKVILNDFRKKSNNKFCNYEGSPIDLMKTLKDWPNDKFKMIISTSSEIEKIPQRIASQYILEDGRNLKVEYFLVGNVQKSLLDHKKPKIAHSPEESLMNFYLDILMGCIYEQRIDKNDWPTDRIFSRSDWKEDKLRDRDIVILKYFPMLDQTIGIELLYNIWRVTNFANIPVPYCGDKEMPDFKIDLLKCFKNLSDKSSTVKLKYGLEESPNIEHFAKVIGKETGALPDIGDSWIIQAVTKEEKITVIYEKENKKLAKEFWDYLYDRLFEIQDKHRRDPTDSEILNLMEEYKKGVYILTSGMRGIIEVANFYFDSANNAYEEMDGIYSIPEIQENLTKGNILDEKKELKDIKEVINLFYKYFHQRKLPKRRIDFKLLSAKYRTSRLLYFVHQHYFNSRKKETNDDEAKRLQKESAKYLTLSQEMLKSMKEDIEIVKTVNDFDYERLRRKERFHGIIENVNNFEKILDIR